MRYVALIRGINVGGHKKIVMTDLKELLLKNGLRNVQTYIQSGNIIFESELNSTELSKNIATYIYKDYNFEVVVLIKTLVELEYALKNNPFIINNKTIDTKKLYVTFLSETPTGKTTEIALTQLDFYPDKFILDDNIIFSYYANGSGKSKMTINIFERKLKVSATSRNWKTVSKITELLSN